jgi:outer membrane receptor protein involved in Fe transport
MGASTGVYAQTASAPTTTSVGGLEEIIVTAQRRNESIQNVPITIQAISAEQLSQLSVTTFDDVVKLLPNVTFGANGPGQGNIFMRGLSAGFAGNQSSATVAPMPNVATYLDDQPLSFPARNADVYMADMERVEVLEGPQGTLFGGGAEAGAVRYITKKPVLNKSGGSVDFSYGTTAHGDPNSSMIGVFNAPLITDKLAVRIAAYNDRRGGYIDNVKTDFTRYASDPGQGAGSFFGAYYPASALGHPAANNSALAGRAQNPTTYQGLRASLLWQINDDWNFLLQQSYQDLDAQGLNEQYPCSSNSVPNSGTTLGTCKALGPWEATWFSPTYNKDRYRSTAWTLNGSFGDLKAVYTGSYMTRHIEQNMDYTNYTRTAYGFYYTCSGDGVDANGNTVAGPMGAGTPGVCYSPVTWWTDRVYSKHQSHEFRITTPDQNRVRGLLGAYWEKMEIYDNQNFEYKTIPSCIPAYFDANYNHLATAPVCLGNPGPLPGTASTDPNWRDDNAAYGQDVYRHFTQLAFFASVDFDLIPKVLTLTAGTRHYNYNEGMFGSKWITSTKNLNIPNGDPLATGNLYGKLIDADGHHSSYSGFKSRANLTWHITPDTMVYYTFSQGFRAGAFNRTPDNKTKIYTIVDASGNVVGAAPTGVPISQVVLAPGESIISGGSTRQFQVPLTYPPDTLTNNEIGFKSTLFNHRLVLNGSIYSMDWKNVQTLIYSPTIFGNSTFGVTGPDYRVRGLELQFTGRLTDALTVMGTFSHNSSKQTSSPCVQSAGATSGAQNPTAAGACITAVKGSVLDANGNPVAGNAAVVNALGGLGDTPAFSPKNQYNLRVRYDWTVTDHKAYFMVGANHTDSMDNTPSSFKAGSTDGFEVPSTTWARFTMPGYTTFDASIGVAKDNWSAELYGNNLANKNASLFTSSGQWIRAEVPTRPRVLGLKVGLNF